MSLNPFPVRSTEPESWTHEVRILGTGAANPTKVFGAGMTITRTGSGAYLITWGDAPGAFVDYGAGFQATTVADLRGFTVVVGVYSASAKTLAFTVYDSTFAAADLAANQWLSLRLVFKTTAV